MDFNKLCTAEAHDKGAELTIIDPIDFTETDFVITLQGRDSKSFRFKNKSNMSKALNRLQKGETPTDEELDELDVDTLVECTTCWRGLFNGDDEIEFTKEQAKQLYLAAPSVREQAERFVKDRENFT